MKHLDSSLKVSYFEIYCGKLFDLFNNKRRLSIREDKKGRIRVINLNKVQVPNVHDLQAMIEEANESRVTSRTGKNKQSSRSHAVLQFYAKGVGQISFIDLAGNERGSDTRNHSRQTKKDGQEISKSLLALKECIRALNFD